MKSLFLIQVGGSYGKTHMENHAIQFHMARDLEVIFEVIKNHWSGLKVGLHLDAYMVLDHVDGFDIKIEDYPSMDSHKLYMVCLGGLGETFLEQHDIVLLVGHDSESVGQRAKALFESTWKDLHVDEVVCLEDHTIGQGYIHLKASDVEKKNTLWRGYRIL